MGIDYFGPILVKHGRKLEKHWICLFSCLTIRAIHMEIVPSLSTNSCLMAIQRFTDIRGIPKEIIADNGTYFVGACNELKKLLMEIDNEEIKDKLSLKNIQWKFNCPGAPHQAGATERMIGSVKRTLKIIMKEQHPTFEVLQTSILNVMNILNNRPLTHMYDDSEQMCSLTPNDILLGRVNVDQGEQEVSEREMNGSKTWKCSQNYSQRFWKRWIHEYRPEILKRTNWYDDRREKTMKIGDLVMIVDENELQGRWTRGRIEQLITNKTDGKVRNVIVRSGNKLYKRPVHKIANLQS